MRLANYWMMSIAALSAIAEFFADKSRGWIAAGTPCTRWFAVALVLLSVWLVIAARRTIRLFNGTKRSRPG